MKCVCACVYVLIGQTPYMSQPVQNAQYNHNILEPTRGRGGGFHFILLNYFQSQNKSRQWPPIALARPQECVGQCGLQWAGSPERVRLINRACFGGWGEQKRGRGGCPPQHFSNPHLCPTDKPLTIMEIG